jgi:hypothetical protein
VRHDKPVLTLAAALAAMVVGCHHITEGAARAPRSPSGPSTSVNPSVLDPGKYPITALPPLGNAGSDQVGRLLEGRRMANYVVGPWQADSTVTAPGANSAAVIAEPKQLGSAVWPPITAGAYNLPFVVGFVSERQNPGAAPQITLRNVVLRFAGPDVASEAAQNMTTAARNMPHVPTATPIVTEPEQALAVPHHADSTGTVLTFQEGDQTVRELTALTAHGPYVLVQVVRCAAGPDCETALAARILDLQLPLIDTFEPTPANQFPALPLDPTGLVARTLAPLADQGAGAGYQLTGALQLEDNPVEAGPLLSAAGVDFVSTNLTTVYQAKDPASAQTLAGTYSDAAAKTPAAQAASPVPGLPQSRCIQVAGSNGLVPRFWCLAAAGRYTIKAVARQLDNAHQQIAAQYRILTD